MWRAESQSSEAGRGGALIAKVAVEAATYAIDKPYDYLVPPGLVEKVQPGVRVTVPFGKGNRTSEGMILALTRGEAGGKLKTLSNVLDRESVLDEERLKLAFWLRERYFCTLYSAVRAILPAGLWYRVREVYALAVDRETALNGGENAGESRALETLVSGGGSADLDTLRQACGSGVTAALRGLEERGLVRLEATATRKSLSGAPMALPSQLVTSTSRFLFSSCTTFHMWPPAPVPPDMVPVTV